MSLDRAVAAATQLKTSLRREVERARGQRDFIRSLDAQGLIALSNLREAFNAHSQFLTFELAEALRELARAHGLSSVTLEDIAQVAPDAAAQLTCAFAEVRSLAAALSELDALNKSLIDRALTCVRSYTAHVAPKGIAYDRHGARFAPSTTTTSSRA